MLVEIWEPDLLAPIKFSKRLKFSAIIAELFFVDIESLDLTFRSKFRIITSAVVVICALDFYL